MRTLYVADRLSARGGADLNLLGAIASHPQLAEVVLTVGRDDGTAQPPCPVRRVEGVDARLRRPVPALDVLWEELARPALRIQNVLNPWVLEWAADRDATAIIQDHRVFCPGQGKWKADGTICDVAMGPETCASCFESPAYFAEVLEVTEARLNAVRRMRVSVLSHYMKRELVAVGVPAERVKVEPPRPYGLDPEAGASRPPCVLFVGRLVRAKGVNDAVAAWRQSGLDLPLVFAGTGPERATLTAEPGVEVMGWVPHEKLSGLYRSASVLLFPPRWQEPFGIAGLEAQTLGTPVAAWDTGGVGEWHSGDGLVAWGDIPALAGATRRLALERLRQAPDPN